MSVTVTGAEPGTCAGPERELPSIRDQCGFALQNKYELILLGVVMAQGRRRTWLQAGPVDAEVLQAKLVAEWAFETPLDHAREGLGVDILSSTWRGFGGHNERSRRQSFHDGEPTRTRETTVASADKWSV